MLLYFSSILVLLLNARVCLFVPSISAFGWSVICGCGNFLSHS